MGKFKFVLLMAFLVGTTVFTSACDLIVAAPMGSGAKIDVVESAPCVSASSYAGCSN
jgi:hypothetical protein